MTSDVNRDIMDSMKITKDEGYNYDVHLNLDGKMVGVDVNDTIGKIWTAPNTAIGLTLGTAGLLYSHTLGDGQASVEPNGDGSNDNAITFVNNPFGFGNSAISLGNVINYFGNLGPKDNIRSYEDRENGVYNPEDLVHTGTHEATHTYQAQKLGPLYLPVYLISGGWSASNPMETEADVAGKMEFQNRIIRGN